VHTQPAPGANPTGPKTGGGGGPKFTFAKKWVWSQADNPKAPDRATVNASTLSLQNMARTSGDRTILCSSRMAGVAILSRPTSESWRILSSELIVTCMQVVTSSRGAALSRRLPDPELKISETNPA